MPDLVGARGERRQRVEDEAGVGLEGFGIGRVEAGEARRRQPVAHRLAACPRRLQPVAQGHQFIDLGDDAVLLGEGWEGKRNSATLPILYALSRRSRPVLVRSAMKRCEVCDTRTSDEEIVALGLPSDMVTMPAELCFD